MIPKRQPHGFSLVEVLAAVAAAGIIAGIAIIAINRIHDTASSTAAKANAHQGSEFTVSLAALKSECVIPSQLGGTLATLRLLREGVQVSASDFEGGSLRLAATKDEEIEHAAEFLSIAADGHSLHLLYVPDGHQDPEINGTAPASLLPISASQASASAFAAAAAAESGAPVSDYAAYGLSLAQTLSRLSLEQQLRVFGLNVASGGGSTPETPSDVVDNVPDDDYPITPDGWANNGGSGNPPSNPSTPDSGKDDTSAGGDTGTGGGSGQPNVTPDDGTGDTKKVQNDDHQDPADQNPADVTGNPPGTGVPAIVDGNVPGDSDEKDDPG